jgi:hypothetical protein
MKTIFVAAALCVGLVPAAAWADDPHDAAMRNAEARARDAAGVRRLNREQLAYVQQRDAGYAEGWRATRADDRASDGGYAREGSYARERARYEREMAEWRRAVAACRSGDYDACD